jgi:hypothetical protein
VVIMSRGPASSYLSPITTMLTHVARLLLPQGRFPPPPPAIKRVSPTSIATAGGWHVVVHGTALTHVTKVLFGARPAPAFTSVTPRWLDVVTPSHAAGLVDIRVVTAHGTSPRTVADEVRFVPIE